MSRTSSPDRPVEQWLKDGADVNDEFGDAVLASDKERMTFLLGKGADIDKLDPQGHTPLTPAVHLGETDTTDFLLAHGAKVDTPDKDGWTPVLHAVLRNDPKAIATLVAKGASVGTRAPGGYSALAIAVEEKKFDAAKALVDDGADVNEAAGAKRITPLMVAASEPPPEIRTRKLLQTMQRRFVALVHRPMQEADYAGWLAVRAIGEAVIRSRKTTSAELAAFLRSPEFSVAGFKGQPLSFRPWDQQLRQPVLLASALMVVSMSPQQGFLHPNFLTDSLGDDEPETRCHLAS